MQSEHHPEMSGFETEPTNQPYIERQVDRQPSADDQRHTGEALPAVTGSTSPLADPTFGDYAGAGFENTTLEEQLTPFLRMAQGLSPELNPQEGTYIHGLTLGSIFNTATREFYDGKAGVEVVACYKDYHYGVWVPRDLGGGFRGALPPGHKFVQDALAAAGAKYGSRGARFRLPRYRDRRWTDEPLRWAETNEEVELVETGHLYVLYSPGKLSADTARNAIVPFTSTSMGAFQSFVTRNTNQTYPHPSGGRRTLPIFAYRWRLSTFQDENPKGKFSNWRLDLAGYDDRGAALANPDFIASIYRKQDPELLQLATEFYQQAARGEVKIDDAAAQGAAYAGDDAPPF